MLIRNRAWSIIGCFKSQEWALFSKIEQSDELERSGKPLAVVTIVVAVVGRVC